MKADRVQLRIEPELKEVFMHAAKFNRQSLSRFLIESGRLGVEAARAAGSRMKEPPASRDGRRTRFERAAKTEGAGA